MEVVDEDERASEIVTTKSAMSTDSQYGTPRTIDLTPARSFLYLSWQVSADGIGSYAS